MATAARLPLMARADRPRVVVVVVQTDGVENASREFPPQQFVDMIPAPKHAWQVVFVAADQDAIADGAIMGFA